MKSIENRRARQFYTAIETYEAGIALKGSEVKSIREGRADLRDSYCMVENGEVFILNMYIAPYEDAMELLPSRRKRKLLLNKREIKKLYTKVSERGLTIIPLSLYFNEKGLAKIKIALCKGKRKYEKKERIKAMDIERETRRTLREITHR